MASAEEGCQREQRTSWTTWPTPETAQEKPLLPRIGKRSLLWTSSSRRQHRLSEVIFFSSSSQNAGIFIETCADTGVIIVNRKHWDTQAEGQWSSTESFVQLRAGNASTDKNCWTHQDMVSNVNLMAPYWLKLEQYWKFKSRRNEVGKIGSQCVLKLFALQRDSEHPRHAGTDI